MQALITSKINYRYSIHSYYREFIIDERVSNSHILYQNEPVKYVAIFVHGSKIFDITDTSDKLYTIITNTCTCVNTTRRCLKLLDLTAITKTGVKCNTTRPSGI